MIGHNDSIWFFLNPQNMRMAKLVQTILGKYSDILIYSNVLEKYIHSPKYSRIFLGKIY